MPDGIVTSTLGALDDLRVIDLTNFLSGPTCTQVLGDLGATVIKVEAPEGDPVRHGAPMGAQGADALGFLYLNRNKQSLALDLKTADGLEVLRSLVRDADVLVENYRPGVAERLGIGYDVACELNPRIIYASISGFGHEDQWATRPGFDLMAQALSGIMSVTGDGVTPTKCGVPITDIATGLYCTIAVLAALRHRDQTGRGQRVTASLFDVGLALSPWECAEALGTGEAPRALGSAHRMSAPYQALRTSSGWITVGANTPRLWESLLATLRREDLLVDDRFATNQLRMENLEALVAELEDATASWSQAALLTALINAGVPAAPVLNYVEVLTGGQTPADGMLVEIVHPAEGAVTVVGSPIRMSTTPPTYREPAPLLGQQNAAILKDAGYSEEAVAALITCGAVRESSIDNSGGRQ
jgi:formyl-CoA transferase